MTSNDTENISNNVSPSENNAIDTKPTSNEAEIHQPSKVRTSLLSMPVSNSPERGKVLSASASNSSLPATAVKNVEWLGETEDASEQSAGVENVSTTGKCKTLQADLYFYVMCSKITVDFNPVIYS